METSQNSNVATPHLDYVPAEIKGIKTGKWYIRYYCRRPNQKKLQRVVIRVKKMKDRKLRWRYAIDLRNELNRKLALGWNKYQDQKEIYGLTTLIEAIHIFNDQLSRRLADKSIRKDTYRSYISFSNNFENWLLETNKIGLLSGGFDKTLAIEFLDHIYYDLKRTARTYNNYLSFLKMFALFLCDKNLLKEDSIKKITRRKVGKKKRQIIDKETRTKIFKYLQNNDANFLTICLTVFFCFIRRTELTKLKVSDVDLDNNIIILREEVSKNKKHEAVTIPKALKPLLEKHIKNYSQESFLFSDQNFLPSKRQLSPKYLSDTWARMRKVLNFDEAYQFYSLKDTGITELFLLNVPTIKIRDQARHYDIKITETYTPRLFEADDFLQNQVDFNF